MKRDRQNGSKPASKGFYCRVVKRGIDVVISVLGLIVLSPVILVCAVLVGVTSKGPVIFKQRRLGRGARVFMIYKFRTMRVNSEHTGYGVYSDDSDPRMTRVGKVLRKLSIDELPQLVNIIKGDMSLIGPRPPLT
ncbi:MAG: sugar transferase, partial [Clostridia bacterium]|nr:sugar transferase [Clostridia bacterium]